MSTSKVYKFCNGGVTTDTTFTLSEGSCNDSRYWTNGYDTYQEDTSIITITASVAPVGDILITYQNHQLFRCDNYLNLDEDVIETINYPSGQTTFTFQHRCYFRDYYHEPNDGRMDSTCEEWYTDFVILDQATLPVCGDQPSGCTVAVDSYVVTAPSQRGLSDGQIVFNIVGTTGSTPDVTYKINGLIKTITGGLTSYTYTGLPAGVYNIVAEQGDCFCQQIGVVVPDGEFRTGDFDITEPADIVASENPVIENVSTKIRSLSPLQHSFKLSVVGTVTNNQLMEFNLTSPFAYSQKFYSKSFPNKSNYFLSSILTNSIGVQIGTNSAEEIAISIAEVLQNDAVLPKVYYIENSGVDIIFTAKETGSRFNLVYGQNYTDNSSGISYMLIQNGTDYCDGQLTDNYNIYCEVFALTNPEVQYPDLGVYADYSRIAELILPFSSDNKHQFNLSSIVKTKVFTPIPDQYSSTVFLPQPIKPFYCKLGEIYPLVPNTNTSKKRSKVTGAWFWVLNASIDRTVVNDLTPYGGIENTILGYPYVENVPFLTNRPYKLNTHRNTVNYLYFILKKDYGKLLRGVGNLYYNDGTSDIGVTLSYPTNSVTNTGGICATNVSYDSLSLYSFETDTKKIDYMKFWLVQEDGTYGYVTYSTYAEFYFSNRPYIQGTYGDNFGVHFQNALGMYDTFDFIGVIEETINREQSTYTKPLTYGIQGNVLLGFQSTTAYDTKITKVIVCNSGWVDEDHFNWLQEMLKSNNIYSYSEDKPNYLILKEFEYIKNNEDNQYNMKFTFEYTIFETNVTS